MIATDELRTANWHLGQGSVRELLASILTNRLDQVMVEGSDIEQLRQVERLGFPLEPASSELSDAPESSKAARHRCMLLPHLFHSELPVQQYEFSVTTEDVHRYGEQSGDLNPLHFDDDIAREYGFAGRISHGMLFNGWFTRLLGTEFPGAGTIYLRSTCVYLAPVYPDTQYTVRISTPRHDPARGTYRILAQLLSTSRQHATIAYADVMNRPPR